MTYIDPQEVLRRVTQLPEWPYLRAEAEQAWAAKVAADEEFAQAQGRVNELYTRVIHEIAQEGQ